MNLKILKSFDIRFCYTWVCGDGCCCEREFSDFRVDPGDILILSSYDNEERILNFEEVSFMDEEYYADPYLNDWYVQELIEEGLAEIAS